MTRKVTHLIVKTSESIKKKGNRLLKPYNLTVEQYAVMQRINEGFDTPSKILFTWGGTKSSLANKLSDLEKKGLIQRRVAQDDKRIWIFSINDKGLKLFGEVQAIHKNMMSKLYQDLSKKEIDQLIQILKKMNI